MDIVQGGFVAITDVFHETRLSLSTEDSIEGK